jgi:TPR repeat protein
MFNTNDQFANRYKLINKIGVGGFSEVWQASDMMAEDAIVAVKIYAPEKGMDEHGLKQFRREYAVVLNLNHPNLLTARHFDVWHGCPYLILPFLSEGSLYGRLMEKGTFSEIETAVVMKHVALGLAYLQEQEIIHQDIKPDNVLIDHKGNYMLTDFGISSRLKSALRKSTTSAKAMTVSYAAPEKFSGNATQGPESDIFAFGVMIYELLTGDLPWGGLGGAYVRPDLPLPQLPDTFSRRLNYLLQSCMNFSPALRPTAQEISAAAEEYLTKGAWPKTEKPQEIKEKTTEDSSGPSRSTQKIELIDNREVISENATVKPTLPVQVPAISYTKRFLIFGIPVIVLLGVIGIMYFTGKSKNKIGRSNISLIQPLNQKDTNKIIQNTLRDTVKVIKKNPITENKITNKENPPSTTNQRSSIIPGQREYLAGMESFLKLDYKNSISLFQQASDAGNTEAFFMLGRQYENGLGVAVDYQRARQFYEKGVLLGDLKANYGLGSLYIDGDGVTKNEKMANDLFQKSASAIKSKANNGDAFEMYILGNLYYNGYGMTENVTEAAKWYRKAADNGYAVAQNLLGAFYENGTGVAKDLSEAAKWYRKAAENGDVYAQNNLGNCYKFGNGIVRDPVEAAKWFQKAADQGYRNAQLNLGDLYYYANGVERNYELAYHWYKKAADQNYPYAFSRLGEMHDEGFFVKQDWKKAYDFYMKGIEGGSKMYFRSIGEFYLFGIGGATKDIDKAMDYFRKSGDEKSKIYLEVIPKIGLKAVYSAKNSFGDAMEVTSTNSSPQIMSGFTASWKETVTFYFKKAASFQVWPSTTAIRASDPSVKKPIDEISYTNYSSSETFTSDDRKQISIGSNKPTRSIGYMYVCGVFNNEAIVIKIPMALAWVPL